MTQVDAIDGRTLRAHRKRELRKAEILKVAEDLFAEGGFYDTSVADIIDEAGISRGTFYLYFSSRDTLFHEILDQFTRDLRGAVTRVRPEEGNALEQLHENLMRVLDVLMSNKNLTIILFREAVGRGAKVDEKINKFYAFIHQSLRGALRQGYRHGITRKVDEDLLAMAILGCIKEILYQHLVLNSDKTPDRDTIVRELLLFGMQGLAKT